METTAISLHPDHLADLRKSGLSDETIALMKIATIRPADITGSLGWDPKEVTSVLSFPYPLCKDFARYKVFPAFKDDDGRTIKYLQKKGSGAHLYILPAVEENLKKSSIPLAIAEGEKKTAALIQAGITTIGIGGVWNWVSSGTREIISEIDQIVWVERSVSLYFDSDIWHRPDLKKPVYALGKELESRGAKVSVILIEQTGAEKIGVDDYLVINGPDQLDKLTSIPLSHKAFSQAADWWKNWKNKPSKTIGAPEDNLRAQIQVIRRTSRRELLGFEKKQRIADATLQYLLKNGTLYVTPEKHGYYFDGSTGSLLSLEDDVFHRFISDASGLNPTETEFKYLYEHIQTETKRRGKETLVYQLAHYDAQAHKLFISDFRGGMWVLNGTDVTHGANGQDGILFVTSALATPFNYLAVENRAQGADIPGFLAPVHCDPNALQDPEECKSLLLVWFLSMFFPELHPTKIIPTFIGPQGSTKTTTARRFGIQLLGSHFNVGHLEAADRGEQAFVATVCGKPFAAFDNADAPIKWLPDRLATFATGHEFELRELYTTNQLAIYKPMAHIVLTSRDPYFRRPDVAERLLIIKLTRPPAFIPESEVLSRLLRDRDSVWSDLLDTLSWTINALREVPTAPQMEFRMADYASFGWRISQSRGGDAAAAQFYESIKKLEKEQAAYTTEEDPTATCLSGWLQESSNIDREIETGSLFAELGEIAKREGLLLPKTSAALGKRLRLARRALETSLDIKIHITSTTHTSRWLFSRPGSAKPTNFSQSTHPTHPDLLDYNRGEDEVQDEIKPETY